MSGIVLLCSKMFDGVSETLSGPIEILVQRNRITSVGRSVERPPGAEVIDLSDRTVSPGFIDTHVHLTMDAAHLAWQTLESSASKAVGHLRYQPVIQGGKAIAVGTQVRIVYRVPK